jgi:glycosyltransferase involved in cell wall biosynthesis
MNITLVAGHWGGPPSGIDRYIIQVTQGLVKRGHTCHLIYSRLKGPWLSMSVPFSSSHQVAGLNEHSQPQNGNAAKTLLHVLAPIHPDLVFFHHFSHDQALQALLNTYATVGMLHDYLPICIRDSRRGYFSRRLCHAPLGLTCLLRGHFIRRSMVHQNRPRLIGLQYHQRLLQVLKSMPLLIVASTGVQHAYMENGFRQEQLAVLPLFTSIPDMEMGSSFPRPQNLLFMGRLTDQYKGADLLMQVLRRCRQPFMTTVIGEGAYLPQVRSQCQRLGLADRVRFQGWTTAELVHTEYQKSYCLVMPSLWAEPFGLVGLEACANATPVVAFDVGGISEWLADGENGFLVPYLDKKAMAEKLDLLAENPELVRKMGLAGRARVTEQFSEEIYMDRLMALFKKTCSGAVE